MVLNSRFLFFIILVFAMQVQARSKRDVKQLPLSSLVGADIVLKKKFSKAWCSRNGLAFLCNHCLAKSKTFLVPREACVQSRLHNQIKQFESLHKEKQLASFFSFMVRVLLQEKLLNSPDEWVIKSHGGFMISSADQPGKQLFYPSNTLSIKTHANALYLDNKRCDAQKIMIKPAHGYLHYDDYHYQGAFLVVIDQERAYLISQLDIEDYIFSVLRWESWPGWPVEVNKAFAIACRSYLIAKVLQANKKNSLYHIKNSNIHQTYNGMHGCYNLKQAIDETRGLILAHNKKPIEAMFDCCCGDVIPAKLSGVNFKKAPYLARRYPCNFCKPCKIYAWRLEYSVKEFLDILHQAGYPIKTILDIAVVKKDSAGAAKEILIRGNNAVITFTGKQFYSLLTKIKSYCYTIEKKDDTIIFDGKGYGHHLGICQWGARRMIDEGWTYASILHFYYPGSMLMELKNTVS
ncbi:MAG: SpoIID/LytB domain-containing protein [Candidatus Babeliales bacterium]